MTTTEQTRAVIEAYIEKLRGGDVQSRKASFTPDATWTLIGSLPVSRTWRGPDEIFDGFLAAMVARLDLSKPVTQEVLTVIAGGDRAVAEWITHATALDGTPYDNAVVIVYRVIDDRIAEAREYFDTAYAERVLFSHPGDLPSNSKI
ncbi:nuclear transport factor 2 family protein [Antrihabitans cavernicola]|uniref:Nuclear transport factor 2 family protein n=1 Tax=Antrihabitans cavernicola TaxID=2495913 RepID=A0A5A7S4R4_9NOCA|nr:nuclear transport factor 2 family protein [Spelaeibacter cavernicola]KAA0018457.1 nuclear transport factor 2 family protein [Spelaeibacter cavernicola]